jgi:rhodanese-related sulfurtransferase
MKKLLYIIIASAGLAAIIGVIVFRRDSCTAGSCNSQAKTEVKAETTTPDITAIENDIEHGALLLDVRTPEEFAESRAVGAINIPYDQVLGGTYPTDDKDTKIYLYCRSGRRAQLAFDALKKAGYDKVTNLVSLDAWVRLGGKTIK